ncbi:phloem protein 2-like protein [Tanacetum coccineum]
MMQVRYIDHMRIPLTEIGLATRKADLFHFDVQRYATESKIRKVSKAELSEYPRRKSIVFIKSLDRRFGQRTEELLRTLPYVSHENLVKIFGFCDEDDKRILVVYEYASNGSLNEYIRRNDNRNSFPWVIRLQICFDAARGLKFLHNDSGKPKGIIHG